LRTPECNQYVALRRLEPLEEVAGSGPMPRFYFHTCQDGLLEHDETGTELPDLEAVKAAAAHSLAHLARDVLPSTRKKKDFSVEVHDEQGRRVLKTDLIFDMDQ